LQRKSGELKELFTQLDLIKCNCLYWFELEHDCDSKLVKSSLLDFKIGYKDHKRKTPAKNKILASNTLYVGVRRGGIRKKDGLSNIAGRIFHHLGYYHIGSTQGLQLVHWCNEKLILKIIELPNVTKDYLNIIEKLFALKFQPIAGKH